MKKTLITSAALLLALGLASCSGSQPDASGESATAVESSPTTTASAAPSSESEPVIEEEGGHEYAFATGMTFGKVLTDAEPSNALVSYLRAASDAMGEEYDNEFTFWTVKIDNREGFDAAAPSQLRAYDKDGGEYIFMGTLDLVEAVNDQLPDAPDATADSPEWKAYEKLFGLYETAFDSESTIANPGAVKEFTIFTGDDLPDEISRMTIDLGGMVGEADVIPIADAESQGYPLDF